MGKMPTDRQKRWEEVFRRAEPGGGTGKRDNAPQTTPWQKLETSALRNVLPGTPAAKKPTQQG